MSGHHVGWGGVRAPRGSRTETPSAMGSPWVGLAGLSAQCARKAWILRPRSAGFLGSLPAPRLPGLDRALRCGLLRTELGCPRQVLPSPLHALWKERPLLYHPATSLLYGRSASSWPGFSAGRGVCVSAAQAVGGRLRGESRVCAPGSPPADVPRGLSAEEFLLLICP